MADTVTQEKPARMDDIEIGSNSLDTSSKNKSEGAEGFGDDKPTSTLAHNEGEEINYHTLSWQKAAIVLVAETVSLGVLSLPSVLATLGLVPGVIIIIVIAALSGYSGLVFGEFCLQYPDMESFGDAGRVIAETLWGPRWGFICHEILGWSQTLFMVFVMGSHLLTWTIALNNLTDSSQCSIMWAGVGLVVFFVLNTPRTLQYTSYMSMASTLSIITAIIITVVDVAVEKPIGSTSIDISRQMGFTSAFLSVTNIAIAFCAHPCFFTVMSELKNKADWPKALAALQILDTTLYLVAAVVIYVFVGPDVPSPALSAAGSVVMRKIIWGVALPTIVIAGVIYAHVAGKFVFLKIFGKTKHVAQRTVVGTVSWLGLLLFLWAVAFVIAESIPVFNSLLSLVAALFVSWFSFGIPGLMWLFLYRGQYTKNWRMTAGLVTNVGLFIVGLLFCVLGLWSTIDSLGGTSASTPWSCASNA